MNKADTDGRFADVGLAVEAIAGSQRDSIAAFGRLEQQLGEIGKQIKAQGEQLAADKAEFTALKEQLDKEPGKTAKRPAAAGGNGVDKTDC
jgi:hypothetical protein